MTRITDPRNIVYLQNFYGPSGRVLRQVLADGAEYRFRYQLAGATSSGGGCVVINPSTGGGATTVTLPFVACPMVDSWENFQAGYTVTGGTVLGTTVVDPRGNTTITRFNVRGYRTSVTDRAGQMTTPRLTPANQVASSTDTLGRTTASAYDANGNVITTTDPDMHSTQFEYHPIWNTVTKITDVLNNITEFTYDTANGNLLTTKDPLTHVTTIAYNSFGQPTSVKGPIATEPPTTFAYDTNGNLIATTDPLGNVTQRVYDAVSRLTSLTDPRGLQTQFRYDGLNRVTEIADARQGLTRFAYDQNGNLLSVTDAKNQATMYTYDSMNRLKTRTDALGRSESYQYDLAGNLTQFTDRKNQVTTFQYDALNRRTSATYADGSSTSFLYDAVGRMTKATDSVAGAIEFIYDTLDRLVKEVSAQGTVEYTYDVLGRRSTMRANGATPVNYGYDAASRLTQVAQAGLIVGLGYDPANRRTSLTYPNGTSASYTYDDASRLMTIAHNGPNGVIESLAYTYDAAGNRVNLTRTNGTATNLPAAVQAAYDVANEQTRFAQPLPSAPNQTFDANGNLTSDGTNTYTWDARNRLTTISGGVSASFVYDVLGRRVSKTINSVTTNYLYDGNDIVQELGGSAVGASYLRSLSIDEPFVRQTVNGNEFYHTDALGSSLALSNAQGASATMYTYEPFGKTTVASVSSNPFQFTGRENDGTGFMYYRARYYSPSMQRFISEDPIGLTGGVDLYVYAANEPLAWVDPSGLIRYNKPPPATVPVTGRTLQAILCVEKCLQSMTGNCQLDLLLTGGEERRGHTKNSRHPKGEAVDIAGPPFNRVDDGFVRLCAFGCGFGAGQFEFSPQPSKNHWHLQFYPGNGVPSLY